MNGTMERDRSFYLCASAFNGGHRNSVRQDKLLSEVFGAVHQHLADPNRLERFRQAVRRRENQGSKGNSKATVSRLENQIAVLDQKLKKATRRLMLVEDDQLPAAQKTISELRDQRDELRTELTNAKSPICGMISDLDSNVAKLLNRLEALKTDPTRADIGLTRKFAQAAISRIDLDVDSRPIRKRRRYRLTGGRIELRHLCSGLHGAWSGASSVSRLTTPRLGTSLNERIRVK